MKPKSPEQAAWDAECKRLLKKITRTSCDEKAKQLQAQYRLHVGLRPSHFCQVFANLAIRPQPPFWRGLHHPVVPLSSSPTKGEQLPAVKRSRILPGGIRHGMEPP